MGILVKANNVPELLMSVGFSSKIMKTNAFPMVEWHKTGVS